VLLHLRNQAYRRGRQRRTSCARLPRPASLVYRAFGLDQCFPKVFTPRFLSGEEIRESGSAEQIMGAFFCARQVYDSLRGFDERFFMYYEEVDFCAAGAGGGFASYYLSNVTAVHIGAVAASPCQDAVCLLLESRLAYARKHFSGLGSSGCCSRALRLSPWPHRAGCLHTSFREMITP